MTHSPNLNLTVSIFLACSQNCEKEQLLLRHVRPSVWNNSAPTGRIFMEFDIWVFLEKYVEEIQVPLKSDKNNQYFT